jgi:hypothetical protein
LENFPAIRLGVWLDGLVHGFSPHRKGGDDEETRAAAGLFPGGENKPRSIFASASPKRLDGAAWTDANPA